MFVQKRSSLLKFANERQLLLRKWPSSSRYEIETTSKQRQSTAIDGLRKYKSIYANTHVSNPNVRHKHAIPTLNTTLTYSYMAFVCCSSWIERCIEKYWIKCVRTLFFVDISRATLFIGEGSFAFPITVPPRVDTSIFVVATKSFQNP